jgi:hypothetical protein
MSRAQVGNLEAEVEIVRFLRASDQLAFVAHLVSPLVRFTPGAVIRFRSGFRGTRLWCDYGSIFAQAWHRCIIR